MARKDITDKQVCEAVRDSWTYAPGDINLARIFHPVGLLMRRTGQPAKVCYSAMERAEDRGLIEYGSFGSWLTGKGRARLAV